MNKGREDLIVLARDIAKHGLVEFGIYHSEGLMVDRPDGPPVTLDDLRDIAALLVTARITGMAP